VRRTFYVRQNPQRGKIHFLACLSSLPPSSIRRRPFSDGRANEPSENLSMFVQTALLSFFFLPLSLQPNKVYFYLSLDCQFGCLLG